MGLRSASWAQLPASWADNASPPPPQNLSQLSLDTERARERVAAEAEARRLAESDALAQSNSAHRATLARTASRTDADLTDEAAWQHRKQLAAAADERRRAEAATLVAENAALYTKLHAASAREDDDLTDEAAWQMRETLAAESAARKDAAADELRAANASERARLTKVTSRTDDGARAHDDRRRPRGTAPRAWSAGCAFHGVSAQEPHASESRWRRLPRTRVCARRDARAQI